MAPIKFEENIREKLERRSLQPSVNAWQSLEQKLNADKKKRHKSKFWWFGLAASFIGLLFIIQQFVSFNSTNQDIMPILVESGNDTISNPIESPLIVEETQQVVQEVSKESSLNHKLNTTSIYRITAKNQKSNSKSSSKVAVITKNEAAPRQLKAELISADDVATAVVNRTESSNSRVTQTTTTEIADSEMEALLIAANNDIKLSDNRAINAISVDANALLEDVETEMPPSLRGQLFKVIEKNFKTAKTAVVTRNE